MMIRSTLLIGLTLLTGCLWQGEVKPVAGIYVPSLRPIPKEALACLSEQTYQDLVAREVEWRMAYGSCKAIAEELTIQE